MAAHGRTVFARALAAAVLAVTLPALAACTTEAPRASRPAAAAIARRPAAGEDSTSADLQDVPASRPGPASAPAADGAGTPATDSAGGFVPPGRGAGAALRPDLDRAPVVPEEIELRDYVASYYDALRRKDWERASALVPVAEPGETPDDFKRRQYGYEVGIANILSAGMNGGEGSATVVLLTPEHGVWDVEWRFVETERGVVVRDLVYARPGAAG